MEKSDDAILVGLLLRKEDGMWKMAKIVLDFGGRSISTDVEVNVTGDFRKDDDTTFGETC